jgi:hypothetical protein
MTEKEYIVDIREVDKIYENKALFTGYQINTNLRTIYVLLDTFQACCENANIIMVRKDDNNLEITDVKNDLIGKEVISVEWGLEDPLYYSDCDSHASINIDLEDTLLQIIVYNYHNGCYPRDFIVCLGDKEDRQQV